MQEPLDAKHGISYQEYEDSALLNLHWNDAFKGALGPLPSELTSPCCSEFMVTRERILARPREFYRRLRSASELLEACQFPAAALCGAGRVLCHVSCH